MSSDLSKMMLRMSDLALESQQMLSPIKGYEKEPLVSLEKAIEPIISFIPDIKQMVSIVKKTCEQLKDNLTLDESASIMLYTLEWQPKECSFYLILNQILREINREKLKPWFLYLRLFIFALSKLPTIKHKIIYRGIKMDLIEQFPKGKTFIWWGFASCTSSIETLKDYLSENGPRTIFNIECDSAKDISHYSDHPLGKEILIYPARQFQVLSSLDTGNQLKIIHLKEISSPFPLIHIPQTSIISNKKYQNDKLSHSIQQCQSHSKIFLREKNLNDDDIIIIIKEAIINKQCKELFLGINQLTSISISMIAQTLNNNTTLKLLDLSENPFGDMAVQSLTKILALNHSHLQYLYLYSTGITDEGVQYLAEMLKKNTILLDLDLGGNEITDQGVQYLANALTNDNNTLTGLLLKENKSISDASVNCLMVMLEHNQSLKFLNIKNCTLSSTEKERLQQISQAKKRFRLEI